MRKLVWLGLSWLFLWTPHLSAQQLYSATNGTVTFFSKAPLEDIEAKNEKSQSIINAATGEVAVKVPIKGFVFPNSLMQEHFNENYLESDKHPFATFKGKINETIDWNTNGAYPVTATGKLTIHGVERNQTIAGKMQIADGKINLTTDFIVALADHQIKVPSVVFMNIAEKIAVSIWFAYKPYVKQ